MTHHRLDWSNHNFFGGGCGAGGGRCGHFVCPDQCLGAIGAPMQVNTQGILDPTPTNSTDSWLLSGNETWQLSGEIILTQPMFNGLMQNPMFWGKTNGAKQTCGIVLNDIIWLYGKLGKPHNEPPTQPISSKSRDDYGFGLATLAVGYIPSYYLRQAYELQAGYRSSLNFTTSIPRCSIFSWF
jgi:hypothetical protein